MQYQQWNTHLQKFDATLAGGSAPDVIEMGNTEMTKYMAAGAFADITADKSKFPNSSTWLKGLAESATYDGKLMGVPYYAGSRIVIYRTDLFKSAGITKPPASLSQFLSDGKKLAAANSTDKTFSPFYVAGQDWYSALAFVYDYGGQIASSTGGKWAGTLDQPKAIQGLTAFKNTFLALSQASKSTDEANPFPTTPFAQGHAASFVGPGWQFGYALDPKAGNPKLKPDMGAFPMPSHIAGKTMPAFLGGSDLAIPVGSSNEALAEDWIADYTASSADGGNRQGREHPEHDLAPQAGQGHARRGARPVGQVDLVRPDRQELDERRELQRPAHHADQDPHRQAVRAGGREVGE